MKTKSLLFILLAAFAALVSADTMVITMKDGREQRYDTDQVASVRFENKPVIEHRVPFDRPGFNEHMGRNGRHQRMELPMKRDAWDEVSGKWNWAGKSVFCASSGGSDHTTFRALNRKVTMHNGTITAKVKLGKGQFSDAGILFRMSDSSNGYGLRLQRDGYLSLRRIKRGSGSHIKSERVRMNASVEHTIRVELMDDRVIAYLDGKVIMDRRDIGFGESGRIGVVQDRGSNAEISDIQVDVQD